MSKTSLRKWDSVEHLKTEGDIALYLETCLQEAGDDSAFIVKAFGNIALAKGSHNWSKTPGLAVKVFTKPSQEKVIQALPPFSK